MRALLPRMLPQGPSFEVHPFQGKPDLLSKLEARLRSYGSWLPADWRIVVVVDRDRDDCRDLKRVLESAAHRAGLRTPSSPGGLAWQVANRIAIEELEAWYFGDWSAVRASFPRVSPHVPRRHAFRDPDGVLGGTWEAFERVVQDSGYFRSGLAKIDVARVIGGYIQPDRSTSTSFRAFAAAIADVRSDAVLGGK